MQTSLSKLSINQLIMTILGEVSSPQLVMEYLIGIKENEKN
jgi:hypothetical protein